MAQVCLHNVSRVFASSGRGVHGVSLEVEAGGLLSLLGPTWSGKTTILQMIAGLEKVDSGTIQIDGNPIHEASPLDRPVGLVLRKYPLYPHLTVYGNLMYGLALRGVSRAELDCRARRAAQMLRIEDILDNRPRLLPGEQRQRIALARALVRQPKVLLMDEAFSDLDPKLRTLMDEELLRVQALTGVTVLFATNDAEEARRLGGTVALLNEGEIEQISNASDLK